MGSRGWSPPKALNCRGDVACAVEQVKAILGARPSPGKNSHSYMIFSYEFVGQNIGTWLMGRPETPFDLGGFTALKDTITEYYGLPVGVYWPVQAMLKWGFSQSPLVAIPDMARAAADDTGWPDAKQWPGACVKAGSSSLATHPGSRFCKPPPSGGGGGGGGGGKPNPMTECSRCLSITDPGCEQCYNCNVRGPDLRCVSMTTLYGFYEKAGIAKQFGSDMRRGPNGGYLGHPGDPLCGGSRTTCGDPLPGRPRGCSSTERDTCPRCDSRYENSRTVPACQAYMGKAGDTPSNIADMRNSPAAYDKCLRLQCGQSCCLYASCVGCAYDDRGHWNDDVSYVRFLNRPLTMATFMYEMAKKNGRLPSTIWKSGSRVQAWPMFSNEVAHNWYVDDDDDLGTGHYQVKPYVVGGSSGSRAYSRDGSRSVAVTSRCFNLQHGSADLCGTFDGFGIWSWPAFLRFLQHFAHMTGLRRFGLYAAQFIMPHWMAQSAPSDPLYPVDEDGRVRDTSEPITLALYQGGWVDLHESADIQANLDMWASIAEFVNRNYQVITSVYMDLDAANGIMTPQFVGDCLKQLTPSSPLGKGVTCGVIVSANPKYGWVTPGGGSRDGPHKADTCQWSFEDAEQPGGLSCDPTTWTRGSATWSSRHQDSRPCLPEGSLCYKVGYAGKDPPRGCPNIIQNAMFLVRKVNDYLAKIRSPRRITVVGMDGENNGTAGQQALCSWWSAMQHYLTDKFGGGGGGAVSADTLRLAAAFGVSQNTGAMMASYGSKCPSTCPKLTQDDLISLPETYWYIDGIKGDSPGCGGRTLASRVPCQTVGAGCNGCPTGMVVSPGRDARTVEALGSVPAVQQACCNHAPSGGGGGGACAGFDWAAHPCGDVSCTPDVKCSSDADCAAWMQSHPACKNSLTSEGCRTDKKSDPTCRFKPKGCANQLTASACASQHYYLAEYHRTPGEGACPSPTCSRADCKAGADVCPEAVYTVPNNVEKKSPQVPDVYCLPRSKYSHHSRCDSLSYP